MEVVLKTQAVAPHVLVKLQLARVSEWRVADVVGQRECLSELFVQPERTGYRTRNLRYLERVGEAVAEVVTQVRSKDLCLAFHAPKGAGVNYTVPVTLEIIAVWMRGLRVTSTPALFRLEPK